MKKLLKILAAAAVSASLTTGMAAAQTGSIGNTGPDSDNNIKNTTENDVDINNSNDVFALNFNGQRASSGEASAEKNTTAGNVSSGNASNSNNSSTSVSASNSAGSGMWTWGGDGGQSGSINNTGPKSDNKVENKIENDLDVTNTNDVAVINVNLQRATTGEAEAKNNTTVGDVTSGDASNTNTTTTTVNVSNS